MKLGSKTIAIVLLFVGLVLINYLAATLPLRYDATAEQIYTLSPGTKTLLGKIEEPVTLNFYFSKNAKGVPISYKNYGARVQEMLRQYVRVSKGKLTLNVINPQPDTPEEERASASGVQPQMLPTGEQIYFGLVALQADQQKSIAAFNPQRESFLEYDISQLVYSVQQIDKKKLGLISSLPLRAQPDYAAMRSGRMPQNQFVLSEWEKTFEVITVEATATELPANLEALAVIHPQNLSPKLQFAIDQFLLSGKPVFLAVDPSSQYFKRQGGQQAMFGGPQPNVSSDLPTLLGAYGITYNPTAIVGDVPNATKVQTGQGTFANYPVWLSLDREDLNNKALPTAQLKMLMLVESGYLAPKAGSDLTFTPLIQTSDQAGDVQAMMLQFAQPDDIARQITPSGKKALAAVVTGKFKSAFPEGAPKDEKPAEGDKKDGAKPAPAPAALAAPALKESKANSTLIVIADTDWLLDDFSVRRMNFLGVQAAEPINDNIFLAANSLEYLGGSQDLVSVRGKSSSLRPFKVVRAMEAEAQKKYQAQLTALEARLGEVQRKLNDLQGKKGETKSLVASPEVQKTIEEFQKQEAGMRRERREVRRALREDIDRLENILLVTNLLLMPVCVGVFGVWFYRRRRK
ncbi:MAG: GldG family protein [Opitutae bacterium]|nr:GldG family protein [Opitutae bacterium]